MPDITTLGKIVGGGLPVGAYGASRQIMETVAPAGPMYQAGTLSGNPLAMVAGIETLMRLNNPAVYQTLESQTRMLVEGLHAALSEKGLAVSTTQVGSMFTLFFSAQAPQNYEAVLTGDKAMFNRYFHHMLASGVYLAPSAFEAGFVSLAHTDTDIQNTLAAARAFTP